MFVFLVNKSLYHSSAEGTDLNRRDNGSISSGSGGSQQTPTTSSQPHGTAGAGSRARDKLRLNFDSDINIRKSPKLSGKFALEL